LSPHTTFHPKWYRPRVSVWWWLEKRAYLLFVLRETSSVFVALFAGVTLLQVRAVMEGPDAYARFLEWLGTPGVLAVNALAFAFVLLHAVTWFNLAPKAMTLRLGGKKVPDAVVAASNYAGWIVASAIVAYFLLRD
jgi:fumarate reductase subunit C